MDRPVLVATHLTPYFATEDGCTPLEDGLDSLDPDNYSQTYLIDTRGKTGEPLPYREFYGETIQDKEKGELETEDAEEIVADTDDIVMIGGRPTVCMANTYQSLVEAGRLEDEMTSFRIDTVKTFMGPGEESLQAHISRNAKTETLSGLALNYDFRHSSLEGNGKIDHVEKYLRELQEFYRLEEKLDEYETVFYTESDRLTDGDRATFKLAGGRFPSGRISPRKGSLTTRSIFADTEYSHDYCLRVQEEDDKAEIYFEDGETVIRADRDSLYEQLRKEIV